MTGLPAWLLHRAYHVLAVPTWERKLRVSIGWLGALFLGRDIASLETVQHPREAFRADADDRRAALTGTGCGPPSSTVWTGPHRPVRTAARAGLRAD